MLFGGSTVSWSVTSEASTVTVQLSENAKSTAGSRLNVVGPPLCVAVCEPLVAQLIVYHALETSTASLKVIPMLVLKETSVAFARGEVAVTTGALSPVQKCNGEAVFRGAGPLTSKSARLLSVSVQPSSFRFAAIVLFRAGVAAVSEQLAPSEPTKSTMAALNGQPDPDWAVVLLTRATLAPARLMLMVPMASGDGRLVVPPAPCASWTR